jgi:hypothetical protein
MLGRLARRGEDAELRQGDALVHTWVRVTSRCQCLLRADFTCLARVCGRGVRAWPGCAGRASSPSSPARIAPRRSRGSSGLAQARSGPGALAVSAAAACRREWSRSRGRAMNVSIIRRVADGDSSDSPLQTARMPWTRCSGGRSFSLPAETRRIGGFCLTGRPAFGIRYPESDDLGYPQADDPAARAAAQPSSCYSPPGTRRTPRAARPGPRRSARPRRAPPPPCARLRSPGWPTRNSRLPRSLRRSRTTP